MSIVEELAKLNKELYGDCEKIKEEKERRIVGNCAINCPNLPNGVDCNMTLNDCNNCMFGNESFKKGGN